MTQHLDEGAFYALLDNEMSVTDESEARAHLAMCADCSARLDEASASSLVVSSGLNLLDSPREAKPFVRPLRAKAARSWNGAVLGRAAALVLMVGAAASATIPGSPVHSWLAGGPAEEPVASTVPVSAPITAAPLTVAAAAESGVGVSPDLGVLRVTVLDAAAGLRVRALLSESPRGGVYTVSGDGSPRFETAPGEIRVAATGVEDLRIEIPRSATEASVTINGRRYLASDGQALRLAAGGVTGTDLTFEVEP